MIICAKYGKNMYRTVGALEGQKKTCHILAVLLQIRGWMTFQNVGEDRSHYQVQIQGRKPQHMSPHSLWEGRIFVVVVVDFYGLWHWSVCQRLEDLPMITNLGETAPDPTSDNEPNS